MSKLQKDIQDLLEAATSGQVNPDNMLEKSASAEALTETAEGISLRKIAAAVRDADTGPTYEDIHDLIRTLNAG